MKKGLKVRFYDIKEMLKFKPDLFEFHMSDKDLEVDFGNQKYDQELVVHGPEYWEGKLLDLCSTDDSSLQHTRKRTIEVMQKVIDLTNKLSSHFRGKPLIVFHPGGMSLEQKNNHKQLIENLKDSLSKLDNKGIKILIENMPPFPWFYGGHWCSNVFIDADEIKKFCEETGYDICFDLSHAQLYCKYKNKDLIEFIETVKPFIKHIHLGDAEGVDGEGLQIDEGEIDFAKTMAHLIDDEITMIPEIWRGHEKGGEGFRIAFERLKKYLR